MNRSEYEAKVAIHVNRIADAIQAALEDGVVIGDTDVVAYYPPELGGGVVAPTKPPAPEPSWKKQQDRAVAIMDEVLTAPAKSFATLSGNVCSECGSPELRNNGTCLLCTNCGATTGCS